MGKTSIQNMTEGNPTKLLLMFTIPMVLGNIFQQLYNMVDSIIVGRFVGASALAAVGTTASIIFFFNSLAYGLGSGVGIVMSQYFGAQDYERVKKAIATSVYVVVISAVVMGGLMIIGANSILTLLNTPNEIKADAALYMRVTGAGLIVLAVYHGIAAMLRALGDSKTPLKFLMVSSAINVVLDLLFVVVFHWSVFGVAFATVIAQLFAGIGEIIYAYRKIPLFRIPIREFVVDKEILIKCISVGVPVSLQSALISLSCVILQSVVNSFGTTIVAAFTVSSRFEQLIGQPFNSLGTAVGTYTGQNIGAGNMKRIKLGFWSAVRLSTIFSLIMLPIALFGGEAIMSLFTTDPAVIEQGAGGIRITCFFYEALGMIYITRNVLNGSGDSKFAMISGIVEVVCRVTLAKPLTHIPAIGQKSIWYTTGLTWLSVGTVSVIRYARGKWKTKCIVSAKVNSNEEKSLGSTLSFFRKKC